EQAACQPVTPASDWYSFGVMLYQALTGRLPFEGSALAILDAKQKHDPPVPRSLAAEVPDDLEALCLALLDRAPQRRPAGAEVLRRLGTPAPAEAPRAAPFVGRTAALQALADALLEVRRGRPAAVFVHGPSGVGKTALVQRFLEGEAAQTALVLA